jgi:hypothetical protein
MMRREFVEIEVFYAGKLEEDALKGWLKEETFLQHGLFLGECVPPHVVTDEKRRDLLYFAAYDSQIKFTSYPTGRIFHPDYELRWEKLGEKWQVVYLGTERVLPLLNEKEKVALESRRIKAYYLFGKSLQQQIPGVPNETNLFAEVRVPRLLHYRPAPPAQKNKERVCLEVYEYLDKVGQVQTFRFAALKRAE